MIAAYKKLQRRAEVAAAVVMPATARALDCGARQNTVRPLGDGRAELVLDGQGMGIYPNEQAATMGLQMFRRMGLLKFEGEVLR